jgi:hypothetical protein
MKTLMDRSSSLNSTHGTFKPFLDIGTHERDTNSTQGSRPGGVHINSRVRHHGEAETLPGPMQNDRASSYRVTFSTSCARLGDKPYPTSGVFIDVVNPALLSVGVSVLSLYSFGVPQSPIPPPSGGPRNHMKRATQQNGLPTPPLSRSRACTPPHVAVSSRQPTSPSRAAQQTGHIHTPI